MAPKGGPITHVVAIAAIVLVALPVSAALAAARHGKHARRRDGFSVRATPAMSSLPQERSVTFTLRTIAHKSHIRRIFFHLTGLPAGLTGHFRPQSVKPGHSTRLTLTAGASTAPGTYSILVSATGFGRRLHHRRPRSHAARARVLKRSATILTVVLLSRAIGSARANVPTHVPTWALDDGCPSGSGASASLVRQWVSYAESNCGPGARKALGDCHAGGVTYCAAVQYLDANWIYREGSVPVARAAREAWWLHQPGYSDAGHRISVSAYGGGNVLNQRTGAVDSWFANYTRANYDAYDALMMDDTSGSLSNLTWDTGFSSSQEITSDAQLQTAHGEMAAALTHANGQPFLQIDNGLSPNPWLSTPFPMLNQTNGVQGAITESDPIANGTLVSYYSTLLDDMAEVDATTNALMVLLSYDPSGSLLSRRVQAATVMLGYSGQHIVSWSDLEQASSHLAVWPEAGVVPATPLQSMSAPAGAECLAGTGAVCPVGGHNDLEVAPGVYRREFATCYDQGAPFGPCAAIVNTTGAPVTVQRSWLTQAYGHEITMRGGDVQSGGTIDVAGARFSAGSASVPAGDAILLSP